MSNLAFHVLARLNAAFDPTEMRRREAQHIPLSAKVMSALVTGGWPEDPKPLSREEIERRERAFFNPAPSRRQSRDVDMYCLPLQGGVPSLLEHYRFSFGSVDVPLSHTHKHLLHYAMNVGQQYALEAHDS